MTEKFNKYYPGGHSNLRVPRDVTKHRLFIEKSKGTHLVDVDGNEYIEYNGAMGPNILGHGHPEYVEKLKEYIENNGTAIGSNLLFSPLDIEVAEKLRKYVPCVEQVKFITSGSEAVQMAFRIMRAHTKKTVIVRVEGNYAGWPDNVLGGRRTTDINSKPYADFSEYGMPQEDPFYTDGKVPWAGRETFMIKWNDFEQLEETFVKYHNEIAGIHLEGIFWNNNGLYPKPGYLEKVRELCTKYNVVLCMDEILTGFRVNIGGAQAELNITPDICTMGKAMSNGIPVACVGGKSEIMDSIRDGRVLLPGTYSGFGLGQCAVNTTLDILSRDNFSIYKEVYKHQEILMDGLVEIANHNNIPLTITESNGVFSTIFGIAGGRRKLFDVEELNEFDQSMTESFQKYMQKNGVFLMFGGRWYINASHSMKDVEKTLEIANKSMKELIENKLKFIE